MKLSIILPALLVGAVAQAQITVAPLAPNTDPGQPIQFRVTSNTLTAPASDGAYVVTIRSYVTAGETNNMNLVPLASVNGQDCSESGTQCFMLGRTDQRPNGRYYYYGVTFTPGQSVDVSFLASEYCQAGNIQSPGAIPLGCGLNASGYTFDHPVMFQFDVWRMRNPALSLELGQSPSDSGEPLTLPFGSF